MSEVALLSQLLADEMQERGTESSAFKARIAKLEKDLKIAQDFATQAKVAEARAMGQLEGTEQLLRQAQASLKEEKAKPPRTIAAAPAAPVAPPQYTLQVTDRDGNDRIRTVSLTPVKGKS